MSCVCFIRGLLSQFLVYGAAAGGGSASALWLSNTSSRLMEGPCSRISSATAVVPVAAGSNCSNDEFWWHGAAAKHCADAGAYCAGADHDDWLRRAGRLLMVESSANWKNQPTWGDTPLAGACAPPVMQMTTC